MASRAYDHLDPVVLVAFLPMLCFASSREVPLKMRVLEHLLHPVIAAAMALVGFFPS